MSPTFETKDFEKAMVWQQYHWCIDMAEHQILGGKHFLILDRIQDWWFKKVQYLQKKYHCQWTLLRGKKPKWIFHNLDNLLRPPELIPASRVRVVPTEWQARTVLGDCVHIKKKSDSYCHLLPNVHFQCCVFFQGTLGHDFDIFAPAVNPLHGCSFGKPPFKTNWREGLSCGPIRLFQHPLCSGRKTRDASFDRSHPKTKEEMRPDVPSLMILMFLLLLLTYLRCLGNLLDLQIRLDYHQDCSQLLPLLVGEEEQELNIYRVSDHDHDLNHRSHK